MSSQRVTKQPTSAGVPSPWQRTLRVVVVDPREVSRRGLQQMLLEMPFVKKVNAVDSPSAALGLLEKTGSDVIVLPSDLTEPEVMPLLRHLTPTTRILILERGLAPIWVAYVPRGKYLSETELTKSMLAESVLGLVDNLPALHRSSSPWRPRLTPRESQTLALLAEGMTNPQIALALEISEHGAKRLVANILAKLNSPNRTMAVSRAIREGLLAPVPAAQKILTPG